MPTPEGIGFHPDRTESNGDAEISRMESKGAADAQKVLEGLSTYGADSGSLDDITNEHAYLKAFAETLLAEARRELEVEEEE